MLSMVSIISVWVPPLIFNAQIAYYKNFAKDIFTSKNKGYRVYISFNYDI